MKKTLLSIISFAAFANGAEPVTAKHEDNQVVIRAGDKVILRYQAEPGELPAGVREIYKRGGYIQSIYSPAGRLITDDFPPDHRHHHGVWSPWTKTSFEGRQPDFWNMGQGSGTVEFVSLDEVWEKEGKAGFRAQHRFVDLSAKPPKVALLETWEVSAWVEDGRYVIDFSSKQKCATDSPLKLPEYHYGGFGFRGNRQWNGVENCRFLAASGKTDRNEVHASREPWCWVGGKVDGELCGVTIVGHPANYRDPQPIRAHPNEPFFCYAPQQLGEMEIAPGEDYVARYRLIVADGEPNPDLAEAARKELE